MTSERLSIPLSDTSSCPKSTMLRTDRPHDSSSEKFLARPTRFLREKLRRIPGARTAAYHFRHLRAQVLSHETTFRHVFEHNEWEDSESASGTGSNLRATEVIRRELPLLWRQFGIRRLVDIPCGDFQWMRHLVHELDSYVGMDVVQDVIDRAMVYGTPHVRFTYGNLLTSDLPVADCIMVRDCLVHFSYGDAFRAIRNLQRAPARFLLLTTFPRHDNRNSITGAYWRPLNMEGAPFSFPKPLAVINEGCEEIGGTCDDKSLGLWELGQLRSLRR